MKIFLIYSLFLACLICACGARSAEVVDYLMGTRVLIRLAPLEGRDAQADMQEILREIRRFERAVSAHREDSFSARLALYGTASFENEEEKSYLSLCYRNPLTWPGRAGGALIPSLEL